MKIRNILSLAVLLCIGHVASADQKLKIRSSKLNSYDEETDKIDILSKEIKGLINRIELLEHNYSKLHNQIVLISNNVENNNSEQVILPDNDLSSKEDADIFSIDNDLPVIVPVTPPKKTTQTQISEDKRLYDLALGALKDNKNETAEKYFAEFITKYPKSNLHENALFWYGETFFKRNMFDKAAINYLKSYKQYPKGSKAADCLLKLALSLGELKKRTEACRMLDKLETDFPSRPASSIKRSKDAKIKYGCK